MNGFKGNEIICDAMKEVQYRLTYLYQVSFFKKKQFPSYVDIWWGKVVPYKF